MTCTLRLAPAQEGRVMFLQLFCTDLGLLYLLPHLLHVLKKLLWPFRSKNQGTSLRLETSEPPVDLTLPCQLSLPASWMLLGADREQERAKNLLPGGRPKFWLETCFCVVPAGCVHPLQTQRCVWEGQQCSHSHTHQRHYNSKERIGEVVIDTG